MLYITGKRGPAATFKAGITGRRLGAGRRNPFQKQTDRTENPPGLKQKEH